MYFPVYLLIALIMIGISLGAARQNRKDAKSDQNLPVLRAPTPDSFAKIDFEVKHGNGITMLLLVPSIIFVLIGVYLVLGTLSDGDGLLGDDGAGVMGLVFIVAWGAGIVLVHYYRRFALHVAGTTMLVTPHFASARVAQPSEIGQLVYIPSPPGFAGICARDTSGRTLFSVNVVDRYFADLVLWLYRVRPDLFTPQLQWRLSLHLGEAGFKPLPGSPESRSNE